MDPWVEDYVVFNDSTNNSTSDLLSSSDPRDDVLLISSVMEGERASQTFALILFAATVIMSLLTIAGNSLIMVTYLHVRTLRKAQTDFVLSLTVANLLVGVTAPYIMLRKFQFLVSEPPDADDASECLFRLILTLMVVSCSACNLCAATADRYVAIMYPLRYNNIMTRVKTRTIIVFLWIYNLGFSLIPLLGLYEKDYPFCNLKMLHPIYTHSIAFVNIFLPIGSSILMYIPIIVTTRRHLKQIKRQGITHTSLNQNVNKKVVQEARVALTTALILGGFVLCWLPLLLFPYIGHLFFSDLFSVTKLNSVAILLSFSHSALCPVVYGWRNREFREALRKVLNKFSKWFGSVQEQCSDKVRRRLYVLRQWPLDPKKTGAGGQVGSMTPRTPTTSEESLASSSEGGGNSTPTAAVQYVFPTCKFCG